MKKLILLLCMLSSIQISAQTLNCEVSGNSPSSPAFIPPVTNDDCNTTSNYVPDQDHLDHMPEINIKANVHFISRSDSTGNFRPPCPNPPCTEIDGIEVAQKFFGNGSSINGWVNDRLASLDQHSIPIPGTSTLPDQIPNIKVRMELYSEEGNPDDLYGGVFFHENDTYFDITSANPSSLKSAFSEYGDDVIDVFFIDSSFTATGEPACRLSGAAPIGGKSMYICGLYSNHIFVDSIFDIDLINYRGVIIHEAGHLWDLNHSFYCQNECKDIDIDIETDCNTSGVACSSTSANQGSCSGATSGGASNNMMSYGTNTAFTPCQIGKIKHKLWQEFPDYIKDNFCEITESDIVIETGENIVWNSRRFFRSNIVIEDGATLTIKCTIGMPEDSKITVEQGGRLILDKGTITNICESSWKGIEVLGSPSLTQAESNQGVVELKNESKIEFAEIGVSLHARPTGQGGGILYAQGCDFVNNQMAISFSDYVFSPSIAPNILYDNVSYVKDCDFELTDEYPFNQFNTQVKLIAVKGITFRDCDFLDDRTAPSEEVLSGRAIYSTDSRFGVYACEIRDFYIGIDANNIHSTFNFSVLDSTVFSGNFRGINARAVNNFSVQECTFEVGGYAGATPIDISFPFNQVGIFIDGCTKFKIMENELSAHSSAVTPLGICSKNTNLTNGVGAEILDYNEIYGNNFNDLIIGNLANGHNSGQFNAGGLTYICNENSSNLDNEEDFSVIDGSIAFRQIDPDNLASGNSFTTCTPGGGNYSNINNITGNFINYYYYDQVSNQEPTCYPEFKVAPFVLQNNLCLSSSSDFPDKIPGDDLPVVLSSFSGNLGTYNSLQSAYNSTLDGGNTAARQATIDAVISVNAESKKNELLAFAPYLSQGILESVVDNSVWNGNQKTEILKEHPEVLKRTPFWDYTIDNGGLSATNIDTLTLARLRSTPRDTVERNLAASFGKMQGFGHRLVTHYLVDSTNADLDSVRYFLNESLSLEGQYAQVDAYIQEKDTTNARSLLNTIFANIGVELRTAHIAFYTLKELQIDQIANANSLTEVDSATIVTLLEIAALSNSLAGLQAENWLNLVADSNYIHEPILSEPEAIKIDRTQNTTSTSLAQTPRITAQPNPAGQTTTFSYDFPQEYLNASLRIFSLNGHLVQTFKLQGKHGKQEWVIHNEPNGIYYYQLVLPDGYVETHKLMILKTN